MKLQDGISIDMTESEYHKLRQEEINLKHQLPTESDSVKRDIIEKRLFEIAGIILSKTFIDYH